MKEIRIMYSVYGRPDCPNWEKVKNLLSGEDVRYVDLTEDEDALRYIKSQDLTPTLQVFSNGHYIGGYEELVEFLEERK